MTLVQTECFLSQRRGGDVKHMMIQPINPAVFISASAGKVATWRCDSQGHVHALKLFESRKSVVKLFYTL